MTVCHLLQSFYISAVQTIMSVCQFNKLAANRTRCFFFFDKTSTTKIHSSVVLLLGGKKQETKRFYLDAIKNQL